MENINTIVGWTEWISLPDLNLPAVKAKVDTGAATSSLHAYDIKIVEKNGIKYVSFVVHPLQRNKKIATKCLAPLVELRKVKSSTGEMQLRPVILTTIKIGNYTWSIELNLTNRDSMGKRMLIGREALNGRVLVNPSHKFLHKKMSLKKIKDLYEKT